MLLAASVISQTPAVVMADIAVVIVVARLMGALFRLVRQPAVVGEIVGGILLGPSLLGALPGHLSTKLFPGDSVPHLQVLAQIGVVLFMFVIGLEVDAGLIKSRLVLAGTVSLSSVTLPFGLGVLVAATVLHQRFGAVAGHEVRPVPFALFIGASLSVTAFPVLARTLADRRMQHTPLGTMALAAAAMDDLLAWSLLALVIGIDQSSGDFKLPLVILGAVALVLVLVLVVRPALDRVFRMLGDRDDAVPLLLAILLVGVLASAAAADAIGVSVISGAFAFGAAMPKKGHEALIGRVIDRVENLVVVLLLPLFFVVTGLTVNVRTLGWDGVGYLGLVLVVAIVGKFAGAAFGARTRGLTYRQSAAVGTLMNTRGLTELVILGVGHELGVLDTELFTILVLMAIVTTVITEPLLRLVYPDRMIRADLAEVERELSAGGGSYRVLVAGDAPPPPAVVRLAVGLAGPDGSVYLSAYVVPSGSAASGQSSLGLDLGPVASMMEDLRGTATDYGDKAVIPLVRVTADPVAEALEQIGKLQIDAVVVAAGSPLVRPLLATAPCHVVVPPPGLTQAGAGVTVLVGDGNDDDTALELGLRLAIATSPGARLTLVPAHPGERGRTRRLAERANGLSPLHGLVDVAEGLRGDDLVLAGVAAAATSIDRGTGPLVAVRSGDDPQRVNLDQRFERVRITAGRAVVAANPSPGKDG